MIIDLDEYYKNLNKVQANTIASLHSENQRLHEENKKLREQLQAAREAQKFIDET